MRNNNNNNKITVINVQQDEEYPFLQPCDRGRKTDI
jgi:hypothetical protein